MHASRIRMPTICNDFVRIVLNKQEILTLLHCHLIHLRRINKSSAGVSYVHAYAFKKGINGFGLLIEMGL
jgi:hypothetical protein